MSNKNLVEIGPESELANWRYELDEINRIITIGRYIKPDIRNVIVYGAYNVDGKIYNTIINGRNMFNAKSRIKYITFDSGINMSKSIYALNMFGGCTNLKEIKGLENLDFSNVTDMRSIFDICSSLTSLDLTSFDTSNVTDMSYMFCDCSYLTSLDVSSFDTSNTENMTLMFSGCSSLTSLDVSSFDTSNVTNISSMFSNCTNLKEIKGLENLDTSNIENFGSMFRNCSSLTSLDLTSFDTSKVTDMGAMFYGCSSLTSLDLTSFDTSNINYFQNMFKNCTNLKEIKVSRSKWVIEKGCATDNMFAGCGCSEVTYVD